MSKKKKKDLPLDAQDGEKCASVMLDMNVHWEPVLCDKCLAYLDKGENPFNKASGLNFKLKI
jgi:hypothetical protein